MYDIKKVLARVFWGVQFEKSGWFSVLSFFDYKEFLANEGAVGGLFYAAASNVTRSSNQNSRI